MWRGLVVPSLRKLANASARKIMFGLRAGKPSQSPTDALHRPEMLSVSKMDIVASVK
jgi:hypothetical protein